MNFLQWIPLIATMALLYLLRRVHIGVIDFKLFVLIIMAWSLLLILFYFHTRSGPDRNRGPGEKLNIGLSPED